MVIKVSITNHNLPDQKRRQLRSKIEKKEGGGESNWTETIEQIHLQNDEIPFSENKTNKICPLFSS